MLGAVPYLRGLAFPRISFGEDVVRQGQGKKGASCTDDDVLPAGMAIGHRRGPAAGGKSPLPQLLAGLDVEGAQIVVGGGVDEHESRNSRAHCDQQAMPRTSAEGREPPDGMLSIDRSSQAVTGQSIPIKSDSVYPVESELLQLLRVNTERLCRTVTTKRFCRN